MSLLKIIKCYLLLVSEFDKICERIKFRVNVSKSKVMRCSRYGNGGRLHVRLNGEPLEKWNVVSTYGRKWQRMEVAKGMWYTE